MKKVRIYIGYAYVDITVTEEDFLKLQNILLYQDGIEIFVLKGE